MNSLKGKVALITGVASKHSMGHSVALRLAGEGVSVVVVDKNPVPRSAFAEDEGWGGLDSVVAEVKSMGQKSLAIVADISNEQEVDGVVSKALKELDRIDILVHCAAIRGPMKTLAVDLTEEEWRNVLDVNLTGSFFIAKSVAKSMIAKGEGGKIVLISSLAGNKGVVGNSAYCASKWGVIGLAKTLALELAQHKININAINPGAFATNLRDDTYIGQAEAEGITADEARKRADQAVISHVPLGRMGTPEDIADLVLFLVTNQSSYITGQAIDICGGWGLTQG